MLNKDKKHPFRRLIIFQFKLAADALRDILLSPVSIICSLLDLIFKNKKTNYFEKLMAFGRHTEKRINLFEQHQDNDVTIDSVLNQLENVVLKEHRDKELSKKTLSAIKSIINKHQKKSLSE